MKCAIKCFNKKKIISNRIKRQQMQDLLDMLSVEYHPHVNICHELLHDNKYFYVVNEFAPGLDLGNYMAN